MQGASPHQCDWWRSAIAAGGVVHRRNRLNLQGQLGLLFQAVLLLLLLLLLGLLQLLGLLLVLGLLTRGRAGLHAQSFALDPAQALETRTK